MSSLLLNNKSISHSPNTIFIPFRPDLPTKTKIALKTHDAARSAKDPCGQVGRELGLCDARVTVRAADTAVTQASAKCLVARQG